ncbi:hypothetical protein Tco_0144272 [Tanacetum coccineum]
MLDANDHSFEIWPVGLRSSTVRTENTLVDGERAIPNGIFSLPEKIFNLELKRGLDPHASRLCAQARTERMACFSIHKLVRSTPPRWGFVSCASTIDYLLAQWFVVLSGGEYACGLNRETAVLERIPTKTRGVVHKTSIVFSTMSGKIANTSLKRAWRTGRDRVNQSSSRSFQPPFYLHRGLLDLPFFDVGPLRRARLWDFLHLYGERIFSSIQLFSNNDGQLLSPPSYIAYSRWEAVPEFNLSRVLQRRGSGGSLIKMASRIRMSPQDLSRNGLYAETIQHHLLDQGRVGFFEKAGKSLSPKWSLGGPDKLETEYPGELEPGAGVAGFFLSKAHDSGPISL